VQASPRVFATLDLGAATTAVALIGRVDRHWRLLGALSAPAAAPWDRILGLLARRVEAADPELADLVGLEPEAVPELPALVARSTPPTTLAVLAASDRALGELAPIVARSGWRWTGLSADRHDARAMTALLLDPSVSTVLVAVGDPPGGDERAAVGHLGALTAAAAARRPDLTIVLAGAVARARSRFGGGAAVAPGVGSRVEHVALDREAEDDAQEGSSSAAADAAADEPAARRTDGAEGGIAQGGDGTAAGGVEPEGTAEGTDLSDDAVREAGPGSAEAEGDTALQTGRLVIGPTAAPGSRAWSGLTELLAGLRRDDADSRGGIARSVIGLAGAIDRRVELLELGLDGGLRATGAPGGVAGAGNGLGVASADGALLPPDLDDPSLDRILGWSPLALDRHRLRDRLLELRATPWAGVAGDGGRLRLAAARAAMARLIELSPDIDATPPADLVVLAGGVFMPVPGAAALLAIADVVRRPGVYQVALDHARLLGPLGTIDDPGERDRLLVDLAGDLLAPLGAVVMPGGVRSGRRPGTVVVTGANGRTELPLTAGSLERVEVAPGEVASVVIEASEAIRLGSLGRRISVDVAGGLGGLLVDLRDVPLRLPDRREPRRELLVRWQGAAWPGAGEGTAA
jgi:hypothetical protein